MIGLVSILVPIYNVEKYMTRCAHSLFSQTYSEIEYIFVDDCSPDKSVELLKKVLEFYPNRKQSVHILTHDRNRGLAVSRQTAINAASGLYVLTVDSDDWIEENMVETLMYSALQNDCDVVSCDYFVEYKKRTIVRKQIPYSTPKEYMISILLGKNHGGTWIKLFRRSLFTEYNITYWAGLNMLEDVSVVFRLLFYAHTGCHISTPFYHYNQTNQNSYCTVLSVSSQKNMQDLVAYMDVFYQNNSPDKDVLYAYISFKLSIKASLIYHSDNYSDLKKYTSLYPDLSIYISKASLSPLYRLVLLSSVLHPALSYVICCVTNKLKSLRNRIYNR